MATAPVGIANVFAIEAKRNEHEPGDPHLPWKSTGLKHTALFLNYGTLLNHKYINLLLYVNKSLQSFSRQTFLN